MWSSVVRSVRVIPGLKAIVEIDFVVVGLVEICVVLSRLSALPYLWVVILRDIYLFFVKSTKQSSTPFYGNNSRLKGKHLPSVGDCVDIESCVI